MTSSSNRPSRSPTSRSSSPSRILASADVQQGNILWLAPRDETLASLNKRSQHASEPVHKLTPPGSVPDDGFYNHPILVLSRPATMSHTIHFLHLTSFGGQKLEKRFRKGPIVATRRNYMTMAPGSAHPLFEDGDPMYRTLTLENGEAMERRGYVQISDVYSMDWRDAQPFWRGNPALRQKTRLDEASLELLISATLRVGHYSPAEQFQHTPVAPGAFSSKSPVLDSGAAAKAPQQAPSRRPSSLPERREPSSISASTRRTPVGPGTPQIAKKTTPTARSPPRRSSPTASLPGRTSSSWDEERQPLLPGTLDGERAADEGRGQGEDELSIFGGTLTALGNAIFGAFHFCGSYCALSQPDP